MKRKISLSIALILLMALVFMINTLTFPAGASAGDKMIIIEGFENFARAEVGATQSSAQFDMRGLIMGLPDRATDTLHASTNPDKAMFASGKQSMKITFGEPEGTEFVTQLAFKLSANKNWTNVDAIQFWINNKSEADFYFIWARLCPTKVQDSDGDVKPNYPIAKGVTLYSGGTEAEAVAGGIQDGFMIPRNFCGIVRMPIPKYDASAAPAAATISDAQRLDMWGFCLSIQAYETSSIKATEIYLDDFAIVGKNLTGAGTESWDSYVKKTQVNKYFKDGGVEMPSYPDLISDDNYSSLSESTNEISSDIELSSEAEKDQNSNLIIIILAAIGGLLVLAAAGGFLYYFLVLGKKSEASELEGSQETSESAETPEISDEGGMQE